MVFFLMINKMFEIKFIYFNHVIQMSCEMNNLNRKMYDKLINNCLNNKILNRIKLIKNYIIE